MTHTTPFQIDISHERSLKERAETRVKLEAP